MELSNIISISGRPGLFEIVSKTSNLLVVSSLESGKRFSVSNTSSIGVLSEILVYTTGEDVSYKEVLKSMFDKLGGKKALSHKESEVKLKSFFEEVLPSYDKERVYTSNIKKAIQWYNLLVACKFDFSTLKEEEQKEEAPKEAVKK